MIILRCNEIELKKKIQELHYAPSKKFEILAIVPVQFKRINDCYQARYFDFYYIFVPR